MRTRLIEMLRRRFRRLPPSLQRVIRRIRARWAGVAGRRRLQRQLRSGAPLKVVIGSSGIGQPGWVATDIEFLNLLRPTDWARYFARDSIAAIIAEHVWEHLTFADGLAGARLCHGYLKPGGYLRIAVPDGLHPDPGYRERVRVGGSGMGADDHKVLYDHLSLSALLCEAGFEVTLLEYFDQGGTFHVRAWDPSDGMVRRSQRFDARNSGGQVNYTSLIVDARKPTSIASAPQPSPPGKLP
jgi:predicted SAM-dependent methyltransferase